MPVFLTSRYCYAGVLDPQKCTYRNLAESELLCVRVATLLRSKNGKHTKSDVIGRTCSQNYQYYCFIVLDICLAWGGGGGGGGGVNLKPQKCEHIFELS